MNTPEPVPPPPPAPVADHSATKSKGDTEPFLPLPGVGRLPIHTVVVGASLFGWLFGKP